MSDLSQTAHNFLTMLRGQSDFNEFMSEEGALVEADIAKLDAALQPAAQIVFSAFKAGASTLVGAGLTAIGPILAEDSDSQATQILNLLSRLGVPTVPPLNIAEQAALVTGLNGLKAFIDRMGIHIMTAPPAPAK